MCSSVFHAGCLDFDTSSLDLIIAVFESVPWTCSDCLELARNSRAKGKCGCVKQNRDVQMIKSQFDKELEDMRARMKSLEDTVSKLMTVMQL